MLLLQKTKTASFRGLLLATLASLVIITGVVFTPAEKAQADSHQYCKGYSSCGKQSKTNHAYSSKKNKSYWGMYAGHNCTNYVSYLMVKAGASSKRPASLKSGNGGGWGKSFKSKTNKSPAMGAVAWWGSGNGYGSTGHVAYVERVISSKEILVSEEGSLGFRWRKVTKAGDGWPSGFIHLKDVPSYQTKVVSQKVYTSRSLNVRANSKNLVQGETAWVKVTYKNVGGKTWKGSKVATKENSALYTKSWDGKTVPDASAKKVGYNRTVTFVFPVTIPDKSKSTNKFVLKHGSRTIKKSSTSITLVAHPPKVIEIVDPVSEPFVQ